uniref:Putative reverse transcriptase domain-containing protein n=1 Tax=Tanacetum cinerariifolium TaxID=118510 RepID=A0A6L2JW35_TANCI|nr:putative reverse transcriptase domain-containing protein [Tanacetum cinerariifolium]
MQLKIANVSLTQKLKECHSILAETSRTLGKSDSIQDRLLAQKEIDIKEGLKLKAYEISVVKEKQDELVKQSLLTKLHYEGLVKEKIKVITDLKLKEEKDIDEMISMEKQLKFLNEIVYKRNQLIQTIHMLAPKGPFNGRPTFANLIYLKMAQYEKPCLYEIPNDQSDPANRLVLDREETMTLKKEKKHSISLELALQQYQEQMKNDTICKEKASNVFQKEREQYFEIQDLKAQLQDKNIAISELKKLIEKVNGKSMYTNFEKPSILGKSPLQPIRNQPVVHSSASAQKKDAQSHKTTKRYMPIEKKCDSKKHNRQIPIGQKFSLNKSSNMYINITPPKSGLTWKPTGRIFTQVGLKWILIRNPVETRYNRKDSASPLGKETHNPKTFICANSSSLSASTSIASEPISSKGSSNEDDGVADGDYEKALVFDDDQYKEEIVSGDVRVNLMVRRSCLTPKVVGDDWLKHNIFQSTYTILGLKTEDHPKPYKLPWVKKGDEDELEMGDHVKAWDQKLCQDEFAYNHVVNGSTGFSLFQMKVQDFVERLHEVHKVVHDNLVRANPNDSSDDDLVGNSRTNFVYPGK